MACMRAEPTPARCPAGSTPDRAQPEAGHVAHVARVHTLCPTNRPPTSATHDRAGSQPSHARRASSRRAARSSPGAHVTLAHGPPQAHAPDAADAPHAVDASHATDATPAADATQRGHAPDDAGAEERESTTEDPDTGRRGHAARHHRTPGGGRAPRHHRTPGRSSTARHHCAAGGGDAPRHHGATGHAGTGDDAGAAGHGGGPRHPRATGHGRRAIVDSTSHRPQPAPTLRPFPTQCHATILPVPSADHGAPVVGRLPPVGRPHSCGSPWPRPLRQPGP